MSEAMLLDVPARPWPSWFTPSKYARHAAILVAAGRHPLGFALGDPQRTCGDCAHRYHRGGNAKSYPKCELAQTTGGPATDCRAKWRACVSFEPQP